MPFVVYIVECIDQTLYTGWTTDIERRLRAHNTGRGAKYTRSRSPVRLVYTEEQPDRHTAMKRELAIKRMGRARKLRLINSCQALIHNDENGVSVQEKPI